MPLGLVYLWTFLFQAKILSQVELRGPQHSNCKSNSASSTESWTTENVDGFWLLLDELSLKMILKVQKQTNKTPVPEKHLPETQSGTVCLSMLNKQTFSSVAEITEEHSGCFYDTQCELGIWI